MGKFIQKPNAALVTAATASIISHFASGNIANIAGMVALVAWIIWSVDEIIRGTNIFRRILGGVVLSLMLIRIFSVFIKL